MVRVRMGPDQALTNNESHLPAELDIDNHHTYLNGSGNTLLRTCGIVHRSRGSIRYVGKPKSVQHRKQVCCLAHLLILHPFSTFSPNGPPLRRQHIRLPRLMDQSRDTFSASVIATAQSAINGYSPQRSDTHKVLTSSNLSQFVILRTVPSQSDRM